MLILHKKWRLESKNLARSFFIEILYTSICHTDLGAWKGENESQRAFPRILGHEVAGIVESVGEGVLDIKEGDHVIPIFNGESVGLWGIASQRRLIHLCQELEPRRTLQTLKKWVKSSNIWSWCSRTCGCFQAASGARARGASRIIGIDINKDKFIKGQTMGMTHFINPKDLKRPVHEEIRELTDGGVDYSFECAGNLDVLREAFLSTHDGWGMTIILGIHPTPRMMPLHPMEFFDGRRITGTVFGDFKGKTQLPQFAEECMRGAVNLDEFITHELPFSKINEAFQLLIEGKSLRCILEL
ncbi:hypothetical protein IFM89_030711 [Coptis chinensis]|uniref:Alcohol dehydrogenase-like C-terminal domain-containing protein n=1 Tax=Coptis chinensis TaxID=261450 RepID=A0A835IZ06_9MAGN|nr:hypothetical protein IFM89_030711 [Coptis chinensis]